MKKWSKILGIIALVAVIGFSIASCGGGGDGDSDAYGGDYTLKGTDSKPNLNIPKDPDVIPSITTIPKYSSYSAATSGKDLPILDDLKADPLANVPNFFRVPSTNTPVSPLSLFGKLLAYGVSYNKSSGAARKTVSENINITLSDMKGFPPELIEEMGGEVPEPIDGLTGFIKGSFSYDDVNGFPVKANGSSEFRVDLEELVDIEDEELPMIGYVSLKGSLKGVEVNVNQKTYETTIKGTASSSFNLSVSVADESSRKWAKLVAEITVSVDLAKEKYTVGYSYTAYGEGNKIIDQDKDSVTYSLSDYIPDDYDYDDW